MPSPFGFAQQMVKVSVFCTIPYLFILERLMLEQPISRVLFPFTVARRRAMIIPLGHRLPRASSDSTRGHRAGRPQASSYLVLLRMGFTKLSRSPGKLVSSYLTFSPLPTAAITADFRIQNKPKLGDSKPESQLTAGGRYLFCGTFLRVAPSRR